MKVYINKLEHIEKCMYLHPVISQLIRYMNTKIVFAEHNNDNKYQLLNNIEKIKNS